MLINQSLPVCIKNSQGVLYIVPPDVYQEHNLIQEITI
uniref:Uncharacterized protein n=1 Tax=Lepeophtheirus salmonis TaxID=72036 RepID=A0A0K2TFT1_LEPSM